MLEIVSSVLDGLLIGLIYGLASIGLTLIFGVMDVVNLAHGSVIALGMFSLLMFFGAGLNPYLALVPVLLLGFAFGVVIYLIAVRRIINGPSLMTLLSTYAVSMIIIGVGTALWSTSPYNVNIKSETLNILGYTVTSARLIAALAAVLVTFALYYFLYKTTLGKAVRAVSNNREAAELMGIPSQQILAISFGIGTALAMLSGALIATMFPFTILSGGIYELKSFVASVLGGLGNPTGALFGGIILGLIEGSVAPFIQVSWTNVIEFVLFVLILLFFPRGLLGGRR
ncbi:branched-chain amino acid ABC transporter permease [Oceanithermus sp.]